MGYNVGVEPMTRTERLEALTGEPFDLLIIGGGITGAGAARDAALRGLRVAIVEQRDWAAGTSSRSSKLVHGGLRYLQTFQLGLVRESTAERAVQLRVAPHLVRPCEFMMPVYADHKHGLGFINLGLWLYDALALWRVPKRHRKLRPARTLARQPNLRNEGLRGSLTYYDAATDDARLTLENILDAEALGAVTASYTRVVELLRKDERVVGAVVQDAHTGERRPVRAQLVINTTGPFTDRLLGLQDADHRPLLRPTKGAHLVVPAARLPVQLAVAMIHPRDGRPMFAIPWGPHVYIGTTDIDYQGDFDRPYCGADDRDLILEVANHYFPEAHLTPADIVGTWCGLRPLIAPAENMQASRVSREHILQGGEDGLLTMAGGKLTTYRLMARELVNRAVKLLRRAGRLEREITGCTTRKRPLPGSEGLADAKDVLALADRLTAQTELPPGLARHLADTYGSRVEAVLARIEEPSDREPLCPSQPVLRVEVDHAVLAEQACSLEDFFARRTQLLLRAPEACLTAAEETAERMGALLGWDEDRRQAEIAALESEVRGSLACRDSSPAS